MMKYELEEFENLNFLVYCIRNAQKTQFWILMLTAFCALRAANALTIWMAYLIVVCRILQITGLIF